MTKFVFILLVSISTFGFAQEESKPYLLPVISFELFPDSTLDDSVLNVLESLQEGDQMDLGSFMYICEMDGTMVRTPLQLQNLMQNAVVTQIGFKQYFKTKHFAIGFQSNPYLDQSFRLVDNQ